LNEAKAQTYDVAWPVEGGKIEQDKFNYEKLNGLFVSIMQSKAKLVAQRGDIDQPAKDAQDKLNQYVKENLPGLASKDLFFPGTKHEEPGHSYSPDQCESRGNFAEQFGRRGTGGSLPILPCGHGPANRSRNDDAHQADLGVAKSNDAPFTSHPDPDMMKYHPLEKFGCSPCHGGNGRALDTVEKGHGRYEHWLWPLYYKENFNAGCQQCHASDIGDRACARPEPRQAAVPRKGLHWLPPLPGLR